MKPEKTYNVTEIFVSVQGEGYWIGTPAIFIRLFGCNMSCSFCDTRLTSSEILTDARIVHIVRALYQENPGVRILVITGGEPMMQLDKKLVSCLEMVGLPLHLETNGTIPIPNNIRIFLDWVTVSPKNSYSGWEKLYGNEIKFIVTGKDIIGAGNLTLATRKQTHYYLSPVIDKEGVPDKGAVLIARNLCLRSAIPFRMTSKLHKDLRMK